MWGYVFKLAATSGASLLGYGAYEVYKEYQL